MNIYSVGQPPRLHAFFVPVLSACLVLGACASPVIKMPQELPDIVKTYKSVTVRGSYPGLRDSGIAVAQGDAFTILAKGEITFWPQRGRYSYPAGSLIYRFGESGYSRYYRGWWGEHLLVADAAGSIYLGYADGPLHGDGSPVHPENYGDNQGMFVVDIIVWSRHDPIRQAELMKDLQRRDPENKELSYVAEVFQRMKEVQLAKERATQEVAATQQALATLTELPAPVPGPAATAQAEQIAALTARLEKAQQALQELEALKQQLATQRRREDELTAEIARIQSQQSRPALPPVIAIVTPQEGTVVDRETVSLYGVAEHAAGIARLEILVNGELRIGREQRDLLSAAKDLRRVEFSEQVHLREGKNDIAVHAYSAEGQSAQKALLVQFLRRPERVWAVIIGINRYKFLPRLRYAVNDAREFSRYLVEVNRVPREHIWLLLDEEATLDRMRSVLGTQLRRQAEKEDTVIIYLAGHGATERDSTSLDGDGLEKYILPHNADPKDLYASALPMHEVSRIFQRIAAERLIFLADTCYSGASGGRTIPVVGTRASLSGGFLERLTQGRGRVILTASDANEVSVEKDEFQHGVFTYYLLEALRGKADFDGDGAITLDEIYRYVSAKVPQATGQDQHPVKKGEMKGQIVLGVTGLGERRQE